MRCVHNWQQVAIPGRIHGDGVPYGKGKLASVCVYNVSSPLGTGETLDILNLWFWLPKALVCNEEEHGIDTYKYWFSKVGLWDLLSCIKGEFLPHDWDWKPWPENHARAKKKGRIMGKYVLPIIQVVADTEHHANHLGLKHWGCLDPCDFCPADSRKGSRMPWSDFGDSSLWMALCVTLLQWMANPTQHPLWENYLLLGTGSTHTRSGAAQ